MGRHLVTSLASAIVAVAQLGFVTPVFAQSSEAIEAARRVNISGRQRMLSQRISKAACFLHVGVSTDGLGNQLGDAVALFETSLEALRRGDESMGLGPEQNAAIRAALLVVANDWDMFSQNLRMALSDGLVPRPALSGIDETGLQLLVNMNRTVNKTANIYGDSLPDMPLILSLTIDLAGRQRMFTQKAAKEFCLIDAGVDVEENRTRLARTAQLFTLTLEALQNGMLGMVMAAPNDEIRNQLALVAEAWVGPKAALDIAASGDEINDTQRIAVVNAMEQVLVLMNEAVGMYEGAIPAPE
ncbi:MAG: type IV pili methyl-accepting chemotaxis transducer N-terminal domain-containing protein [Rhodobacteraceae bacterium]|nr:type IV pili methyl-accepting chemotaxis transducer N-terminal domain-containing protein [Paracoccaceae bacterium]